ncbi:MAG: diguanylate cyclase [Alphaproteobacteria bacterium]|nr:diguanylate cyclase [Alphaproteobacteria bacterium]
MRSALPLAVRDQWDVDTWAIAQVESASAPALVSRGNGTLVAANALADVLIDQSTAIASVTALVQDTDRTGRTQVVRVRIQGKEDGASLRRFDLTLIPLPSGFVYVIAREVTLEANLTGALVASRELFRDLALCATDFSFETDHAGFFAWASPNGALGYSASELHGSHPRVLFGDCDGVEQFSTRCELEDAEIWCRTKSGEECCLALRIVPLVGGDGIWRGTRGVARDVTALRNLGRTVEESKRRDELIGAIVGAVRGQIEPRRMMLAAVEALAAATQSDHASLRPVCLDSFASIGAPPLAGGPELRATTTYQGKANGAVLLTRGADGQPFSEAERSLLDAVVPHLGVAIALVETLTAGGALPCVDAASGLLSSSGFFSDARSLMGEWARAGRACALIRFENCDSDVDACCAEQSPRGDFYRSLGRLLCDRTQSTGLATRCGPDAFALLLEGSTREDAVAAAEDVSRDVEALCAVFGLTRELHYSFCVAFAEAESGETAEELVLRCEGALKAAKCAGHNCISATEPTKKVMSC